MHRVHRVHAYLKNSAPSWSKLSWLLEYIHRDEEGVSIKFIVTELIWINSFVSGVVPHKKWLITDALMMCSVAEGPRKMVECQMGRLAAPYLLRCQYVDQHTIRMFYWSRKQFSAQIFCYQMSRSRRSSPKLQKLYWGRKYSFPWVAWNWVINLRFVHLLQAGERKLITQFHATHGK